MSNKKALGTDAIAAHPSRLSGRVCPSHCRFAVAALLACACAFVEIVAAQPLSDQYTPVTESMLLDPPDGEWLMWRRTYDHWGYSPLDQITTSNVDDLRLAWAWTLADGLQETTPLVHDGIMFLPQACDFVEALDARDGTLLWQYEREQVDHQAVLACANRNGVLYEDKLYIATHDAYLVALDAATGEFLWARSTNYQNAVVGVDFENRRGIANETVKPVLIDEPVHVCPHLSGGKNWQAVAYSPLSNSLYVPSNNTCMNFRLLETDPTFGAYHGSAITGIEHVPDSDEQVGLLTAVDVETGQTRWQLRQRAGVGGSVLTTGGGLVL